MSNHSPQGYDSHKFLHICGLLMLLCAGIFFLLLHGKTALSALQRNFGWINLNYHLHDSTNSRSNLAKGLDWFSQAVKTNRHDESAWLGLGMAYLQQGQVDLAINAWSQSVADPAILIAYGETARGEEDLDASLAFLRTVDALDNSNNREGYFVAGTVCQRSLGNDGQLIESNKQFCLEYLADNDNNLIVNGDFAAGELYGWEGEHFFGGSNAARLQIEDQDEPGNLVLGLTGQNDANHYGLYQRVNLAPGETVRFSGRFKIEGADNLSARLLYIGWHAEDGTEQGNHGVLQSEQMAWTEFERIFRIPENTESLIDFYPVTFSGRGTVWIDDIRLEIIHE